MIKYDHLLGKQFDMGKCDCYSIVRDFYKDNYDIDLPNYARPGNFWEYGMDMYRERFRKHGFEVINCNPSEYQIGDVFLMSIQANVANHAAVLVDNGRILHHLVGQISTVTPYRSLWRNNTVAVVRHKKVKKFSNETAVNILDVVPDHIRRKVNEYLQENSDSASQ